MMHTPAASFESLKPRLDEAVLGDDVAGIAHKVKQAGARAHTSSRSAAT
jgi:hypothetical protein